MERLLDRGRVDYVPARDWPDAGELDRRAGLLALVRDRLEGAEGVRLHEDPLVRGLDLRHGLRGDRGDDVLQVPGLRLPERGARDRALQPARGDLHAGRRGDAGHGVEPVLRVPDLVQGLRPEDGLHLRDDWLARGPEDDRVPAVQHALVHDRVQGDAEALLLLDLEDRALRGALRNPQVRLQEPLREPDQHEEELRDADAVLRARRDDRDGRREVLDLVVPFRGEAVLEELADDVVHPAVELLADALVLLRDRRGEGDLLHLPPARDHVDLVRGDEERRLVPLQDVDRLDRLRAEALVHVHDEDREVREGPATRAERREGDVARGVDEQEPGDLERLVLHEVPADRPDRVQRDLRGPDVLGDPARLPGHDARPADLVEEAGLAVVHVAEDGDDGLADVRAHGRGS